MTGFADSYRSIGCSETARATALLTALVFCPISIPTKTRDMTSTRAVTASMRSCHCLRFTMQPHVWTRTESEHVPRQLAASSHFQPLSITPGEGPVAGAYRPSGQGFPTIEILNVCFRPHGTSRGSNSERCARPQSANSGRKQLDTGALRGPAVVDETSCCSSRAEI